MRLRNLCTILQSILMQEFAQSSLNNFDSPNSSRKIIGCLWNSVDFMSLSWVGLPSKTFYRKVSSRLIIERTHGSCTQNAVSANVNQLSFLFPVAWFKAFLVVLWLAWTNPLCSKRITIAELRFSARLLFVFIRYRIIVFERDDQVNKFWFPTNFCYVQNDRFLSCEWYNFWLVTEVGDRD